MPVVPCGYGFFESQGPSGKRFREYDIAVLLESRDLFVTIRFPYVTRIRSAI